MSGTLELHLVGVSNDLVHSFDTQAGLGREIINDRADNAAQGRLLLQDEFDKSLTEMRPFIDCLQNHFTTPLPQWSPLTISQQLERVVLFLFDLTGYRSSAILVVH